MQFFYKIFSCVRLFNLKEKGGWMDRSFTELFELMKEMLLEDNPLPNCSYEAKKILCPMGLDYVKIHVYRNDCILYMKDYENLKEGPRCGESCYKQKNNGVEDDDDVTRKGIPSKVMWYLSIIQRFMIICKCKTCKEY